MGRSAPVVLVVGPPCSGKSTLVREHMRPGDLVIDYDALAVALGSPDSHDHPPQLVPYVLRVTDALLDRAKRDARLRCVWYIRCSPTARDIERASEVLVAPTSMDECLRRARAAGRPERVLDAIRAWTEPQV